MVHEWIFLFTILTFFVLDAICGSGSECVPQKFNYSSFVCVCNSTYCDFPPKFEKTPVSAYQLYTSSQAKHRFKRTLGYFQSQNNCTNGTNFVIDKTQKYQKLHGFGGAFTDSAGINIASLSLETQDNLLCSYFSSEGIGYNLGRVPIAGTDFSTREYTYDDHENDFFLELFSLQKEDKDYKIPLMQKARKISGQKLRFFAAAWSAPSWMLTDLPYRRPLEKKFYQVWAQYHIRFLEEYKKCGVDFWAISTGNEPFTTLSTNYSLIWSPQDQNEWIANNFGPTLRNSNFSQVLILGLDDQRTFLPEWTGILALDPLNPGAAKYIDGIAVHFYLDNYTTAAFLDETHVIYPDKFILYTEATFIGGTVPAVQLGSWERAESYASNIIEDLNHWVTGWVDWNLALDLQGGPNWVNNFCDAAIIVNAEKDEYYKQPMFYALGHFSKFLSPGGCRIGLTPEVDDILAVAVLNPDNSIAVVFLNKKQTDAEITVTDPDFGCIKLKLPEKSINTLVYWV